MMRDSLGRSVVVRGEARRGMEIMQVAWGRAGCERHGDGLDESRLWEGRHGDHAGGLEEIRLVRDIGDHASGLDESRLWRTWRSCK